MTELDPTTRDLRDRLADITTNIAVLQEHADTIKAQLRAQLPPGQYTADGHKALTITPNRRFDPTRAEQVLPPELLELCRVSKVDPATARKVLPPAVYWQAMVEVGEPVIRLA